MIYRLLFATAGLAAGMFAVSSAAEAQRQTVQPVQNRALPLCREAEAGERCRTRGGEVRVRHDERRHGLEDGPTNNLGGGDPGWEVRDQRSGTGREDGPTNNLGGGDPGWEVRDQRSGTGREDGPTNNLGGGDPGWEVHDQRGGAGREDGPTNNLGGGDPGWEVHDGKAPGPEAMD